MSDKQNLGPGSTKDRLDAALEWNAASERQAGKRTAADEADAREAARDDDRKRERASAAAAGREVPDLEDDAGDRGC
jgi:hypothetical protein